MKILYRRFENIDISNMVAICINRELYYCWNISNIISIIIIIIFIRKYSVVFNSTSSKVLFSDSQCNLFQILWPLVIYTNFWISLCFICNKNISLKFIIGSNEIIFVKYPEHCIEHCLRFTQYCIPEQSYKRSKTRLRTREYIIQKKIFPYWFLAQQRQTL